MYDGHHGGHHGGHHHGGHHTQVVIQQQPVMGVMTMAQPMPQTVVVMQQQHHQGFQPGPWHHSFCGCLEDIPSCLISSFCPCIQYGQNYEALHHDGCLIQSIIYACLLSCGLQCLVHMGFRGHVKSKFSILGGGGLEDLIATWCCFCCALSQEAREINHRRNEAASKGIPF